MHLNKDYESEINLRDLFFYILYHWRSILLIALIGMLLLGGYKYMSVKNVLHSDHPTQEEQIYENSLKNSRELVQEKQKQIDDLENYRNESLYFQLNPMAIWTASCKYLVEVDSDVLTQLPQGNGYDPADSILAVYTMPFSEISDEELTDTFHVKKPEYAYELVGITKDETENTVTVRVRGYSEEYAQEGLDFLKKKIDKIRVKASQIASHTLSIIGEETIITADSQLLENQKTLDDVIKLNNQNLYTERLKLNELEVSGGPQNARKQLIKFLIIGFAAGAFLMIFIYAFRYVFRSRLTESRELSDQYNLPLFAEFSRSGSLHNDRGLDKLFSKWELGKKVKDTEKTYDDISALINEKKETSSILLVSSLNTGKLIPLQEALAIRLPEKKTEAAGDFLTNSDAITKAAKADAVILVEEKQKTRRKDIERMAEMLSISNANVIGAIML